MNKPLSAIELAKLKLQAIAKQTNEHKQAAEASILKHTTEFVVPSLVQAGLVIDQSQNWNEMQLKAINAGVAGKSFCLIGAAGTGKTTTQKGIVNSLIKNNMLPILPASGHNHLRGGIPGIVITSFTNMAVRQSAKHFSKDVTCVTIHKLLEFAPVYYDITDSDGNVTGTTMRFEPSRHAGNPLPRELKTILIDEASMVDTELFALLWDALPNPHAVQFIFFGDLNQLPPVYGSPILGRKLLDLPVVELTEVYRQAMLSPIVSLAHDIKNGKGIPTSEGNKQVIDGGEHGRVVIHPWSKRLGWEDALNKAQAHLRGALQAGIYDPMLDMVLCPFNVNFGVVELNNAVAQYLGDQRGAVVHEIIAGHEKKYLAVGDKVLVQKQEAIVTRITKNPRYFGKGFSNAERYHIDRYGGTTPRKDALDAADQGVPDFDNPDFDVDNWLESMSLEDVAGEARKHQASHQVEVAIMNDHVRGSTIDNFLDKEWRQQQELTEFTLNTAAEFNEMLMGYAITVHKSQGSEWRNVFIYLHQSHARMTSRELVYTAMTRAKEYLYIICEPDRIPNYGSLTKAAKNPRLKGNTLAEKLVALKEMFDKQDQEKED